MIDQDDELMTASEARELLGVARTTLARMLRDGRLSWQLDPLDARYKLVRRRDVEAMLAARRPRPGPAAADATPC